MNEKKCSGERCPMQYPYNADTCRSADDCQYYSPKKDLVEVVRCRDCVESGADGWVCCGSGMMPEHVTFPHLFCSEGKRKDGDV